MFVLSTKDFRKFHRTHRVIGRSVFPVRIVSLCRKQSLCPFHAIFAISIFFMKVGKTHFIQPYNPHSVFLTVCKNLSISLAHLFAIAASHQNMGRKQKYGRKRIDGV
ncbi:hypothetical protein AB6A40_007324 [Gnathostoma spinigerum]|uniref:Uncharacterized protein n=1 Tax=Gnathostoma spinigerum TaxID=75299 RepID=A0ABD6EKW7_9BILA